MTGRDQALVFGEVAQQYDTYRPGYPDAVFDAVMAYGALHAGDAALEIGAGTGKATVPFAARGLVITSLEPSPGMAEVLRTKVPGVHMSTFDAYDAAPGAFRLVYAAQAWHWVKSDDRYQRAAAALTPGGAIALFWNLAREWTGPLGDENDAIYQRLAPHMTHSVRNWNLDRVLDELDDAPGFSTPEKRVIPWTERYSRTQYEQLLGTHSDHRILPDDVRAGLHREIGDLIDDHGGFVDVDYDVNLFLSRRV